MVEQPKKIWKKLKERLLWILLQHIGEKLTHRNGERGGEKKEREREDKWNGMTDNEKERERERDKV